MTTQHDKAKRWRPKFSIRTLVVVVTLVCVWLACWLPTARNGESDVVEYLQVSTGSYYSTDYRELLPLSMEFGTRTIENTAAVFPFVVLVDEWRPTSEDQFGTQRRYYFWFFGFVAKLPYEREVDYVDLQ